MEALVQAHHRTPFGAAWLLVALVIAGAAPAVAGIEGVAPTNWSPGTHAVASLSLDPADGWTSIRTYFRVSGSSDYYFVEATPGAALGEFWAMMPSPAAGSEAVDMYFEAVGQNGDIARTEPVSVNIAPGPEPTFTAAQWAAAGNIVLGETTTSQRDAPPLGFECTGIVSRFGVDGQLHPDTACNQAIVAATTNKWLVPAGALALGAGAGYVVFNSTDECVCSPCEPCAPCAP